MDSHAVHLSWEQRNVGPSPSQVTLSTPSSQNQSFEYLLLISTEAPETPKKGICDDPDNYT